MNNKLNKTTSAIIIIGNEILSGRTQEVNLSYLSIWLNKLGVRVEEVRIIPDIENKIVNCVNELRKKFNYVFTTGGIGPTHDDITAVHPSLRILMSYFPSFIIGSTVKIIPLSKVIPEFLFP